MKHSTRVRVERDGGRLRFGRPRAFNHRLHYPLMAEMQPVKNPERQYRRAMNISVLGSVKDLHLCTKGLYRLNLPPLRSSGQNFLLIAGVLNPIVRFISQAELAINSSRTLTVSVTDVAPPNFVY